MKERMLIEFFAMTLGVFFVTWLILRKLIPVLKSRKIGQKIYDIGPRWHKGKEGTPIMGGLGFIIATLIGIAAISGVYLYLGRANELLGVWLTLALALLNGLIGFFDDYTKLIKKQNQGFLAWQKLVLQLLVAAAYLWAMSACGFIDTALEIPYFDIELELGIFYYFFAILFIAGMVNSVNLTDGIDGLCSSVSAVVGAFFAVVAFVMLRPELAIFPATVIGGTVGFLMYNFYPAKIFMGDTGSLYLGGAVVGMAFLIEEPLIIMIAGIIYLIEVASVILQVGYFKITHGKRIFKMAPIHHHFEKCGWSEVKIVGVFTLITAIACALAYFGL
ncbi:MAG: phospho-N-acetylmuramoyl-pentapeptide-transferase [Clostridia bacterium]|nr:phospho-N-acetylmuramoyl-pentapeptide-transferase [Clostridia bacterium]MBQ3228291.1 phospho-N-acetylmuramoyl-pentapeptide-transferase [Clostridia bacterium]MBR6579333.1 phospho-N-acetylmuramoyl-pentapeptide-transferase [Clostridia bacterium]